MQHTLNVECLPMGSGIGRVQIGQKSPSSLSCPSLYSLSSSFPAAEMVARVLLPAVVPPSAPPPAIPGSGPSGPSFSFGEPSSIPGRQGCLLYYVAVLPVPRSAPPRLPGISERRRPRGLSSLAAPSNNAQILQRYVRQPGTDLCASEDLELS